VEYKQGSTQIEPALATSWSMSSNGRVWIFHLRHGVKFQDGTPFNAQSVVFNFKRQMDPQNPYHAFGKFIFWQTMWGGFPGKIIKVQALDPYTVRFVLSQPMAPFLANLAMIAFAISSPTAIRKWGPNYFKHPVGTGPFKLVLWEKEGRIVLDANPDYWGGAPKIKRLIFVPIHDSTARLLELERGDIDLMTGVNVEDVAEIRSNPKLTLDAQPGMNIAYLALNCQKPPFTDVRVRQAIRYAINKKRIITELYQGMALAAVCPMPPMMLGYDQDLKDFPYDPTRAKKLLEEAGYPHGFSTTLWYLPIARDYMPEGKAVGEAIQADLLKVGIKAKLLTFDWGTYLEKTEMGDHTMALFGWIGDNGDPDDFLYALLDKDNARKPAQNIAFYTNEAVHKLLVKAQQTLNPALRAKLYREAEQIINRDSPWVPIAYADQIIAYRKNVVGFVENPTGMLRFQHVEIVSNGIKKN
jgi:peptide/nickel transport system substrate-binding protein